MVEFRLEMVISHRLSKVDTVDSVYFYCEAEWFMRHNKNSHNSTLFHTLSHCSYHITRSSGAYTHDIFTCRLSKSHFSAIFYSIHVDPNSYKLLSSVNHSLCVTHAYTLILCSGALKILYFYV